MNEPFQILNYYRIRVKTREYYKSRLMRGNYIIIFPN